MAISIENIISTVAKEKAQSKVIIYVFKLSE